MTGCCCSKGLGVPKTQTRAPVPSDKELLIELFRRFGGVPTGGPSCPSDKAASLNFIEFHRLYGPPPFVIVKCEHVGRMREVGNYGVIMYNKEMTVLEVGNVCSGKRVLTLGPVYA